MIFFGESNALLLGSVVRVVNSSQRVIVGDSKSFKTNLSTAMTSNVLCENLLDALVLSFVTVCLS